MYIKSRQKNIRIVTHMHALIHQHRINKLDIKYIIVLEKI